MSYSPDSLVVLTVRGTLVPKTLEAARVLHNETAGSAPGVAAARALGDLSHNVYTPRPGGPSNAKDGELLFLDRWDNPKGIMEFFSNPHVQQQGSNLFAEREPTIWMPARGSFSYRLPAPKSKTDRYVGLVRGPIASPEAAIATFAAVDAKAQRDARRRGLLSHEVFIKLAAPGDTSPVELLGIDVWCDLAGMGEHYGDATHMAALGNAFTARAATSVWEQAAGAW